jgi:hypothetical protein
MATYRETADLICELREVALAADDVHADKRSARIVTLADELARRFGVHPETAPPPTSTEPAEQQ